MKNKKLLKLMLIIIFFVISCILVLIFYILSVIRELPNIYDLKNYHPSITSRIYADNNELIDEFFIEDRRLISISKIPSNIINAFIAAEDARFFQHKGIDLIGILRAFLKNLEHRAIVQGGSTITQQVAKSFYLSSNKTIGRKIRELILAYRINKNFTKNEILNIYLNQIYLGHGTYGIEAAAQFYFAKSASELTLSEAAILAGLPKAPSHYSPFINIEKTFQRQIYVLNRMVEEGYITEKEKKEALKIPIKNILVGYRGKIAPYFTENVRRYIITHYGSNVLYKEGLEIFTTLNIAMQKAANNAVEKGLQEFESRVGCKAIVQKIPINNFKVYLAKLDKKTENQNFKKGEITQAIIEKIDFNKNLIFLRLNTNKYGVDNSYCKVLNDNNNIHGNLPSISIGDVVNIKIMENNLLNNYKVSILPHSVIQAALLCMNAKNGEIKAMVGGRDFKYSEFNRATQAKRQPGSAFKPLIYTAAFDKGLTDTTIMVDEPISFNNFIHGTWTPRNADRNFKGAITLRSALIYSRNIITIKVLQHIGVDYAASYIAHMGISSPINKNLSMALGTSSVTLQEMVRSFGVLANYGKKVEPYFIKKIINHKGKIYEFTEPRIEKVIDPQIAFLTTSILQDAVKYGTGHKVKIIGRPVAGKTGTTDDQKDAWFIGYTPTFVTGVWVGFDDCRSLGKGEMGGVLAAPIWLYFMEKALNGKPIEIFEPFYNDIKTNKIFSTENQLLIKELNPNVINNINADKEKNA